MKKHALYGGITAMFLMLIAGMPATEARAGDEPFIGEMLWVSFNFAPRGWARCDGQLLSINQNQALFALLGTQYGGDGKTTFALPDMRGRVPINAGQGTGSNYVQGQTGGGSAHALTVNEMPAHNHGFQASTGVGNVTTPAGNLYGQSGTMKLYGPNPAATMAAGAIGNAGSGQPHNNMMPFTTLNCIIAVQGIFPARN
jgi:microcystin-dependent protein